MSCANFPNDIFAFKPRIQPKRGCKSDFEVPPVPVLVEDPKQPYIGIFNGISVVVEDSVAIKNIHENGFYGKGSHSRGAPSIVQKCNKKRKTLNLKEEAERSEETLVLMLEEAYLLAYIVKCLVINDLNMSEMGMLEFVKNAEAVNPAFIEFLTAYIHLKSKDWIVKSGVKFGGDFLAYHKGPQFFHASLVAFVKNSADEEYLLSKSMKGTHRVAETSGKDIIILEVAKPKDFQLQVPNDLAHIRVSGGVIRRFNLTGYVQEQNKGKKST